MIRYVGSRIIQAAATLLGVAVVTFALLFLVPADPARQVAGRAATAEIVGRVRHEMGLDQPIAVQFVRYLGRLTRGDLGRSYVERTDVTTLVMSRLPATLWLMLGAIGCELLIGLPAGLIAAQWRGRLADRGVMVLSFVGVSTPQFIIAILLLYFFAGKLGWFPIGGYGGIEHLVLPAMTLGILGGGWYGRMTRSTMVEVLHQDFIRTARAKGMGEWRVVLVHGLRNAVLPILAMIGIDIGVFMGGAVVVESVYAWPGIGQLTWHAIQQIDIPVIMAVTLVAATGIVLANLFVDLIAPAIDPRVKIR